MNFWGYRRPDGRGGVRNKILILPASICAADTARIVASQVEGAVTFHNQNGCAQIPSDQQLTMDVMAGFAANPNIYGTVVVSLGCENCQMDLVVEAIRQRTNKPLRQFIIQECGGTIATVEKATRAAKEMGLRKLIITHVNFPSTFYTLEEQQELLACGAFLEHCYTTYATGKVDFAVMLEQIRRADPERVFISSDLGQKKNVYPDEGILDFSKRLVENGFTPEAVHRMNREIPKYLAGR